MNSKRVAEVLRKGQDRQVLTMCPGPVYAIWVIDVMIILMTETAYNKTPITSGTVYFADGEADYQTISMARGN